MWASCFQSSLTPKTVVRETGVCVRATTCKYGKKLHVAHMLHVTSFPRIFDALNAMGLEWLLKTAKSTTLGHDVSHDLSKQRPCTPSCVSITINYVSIRPAACRHACATAHDACRNYPRQATRAPQDGLGEGTFGILGGPCAQESAMGPRQDLKSRPKKR